MKKQNSKLFAKFEDLKIVGETIKKIKGGGGEVTGTVAPPENSTSTGDHDCTVPDGGAAGADCGDAYNYPKTQTSADSTATTTTDDSCGP
jgi:hypothetical protein